MLRKVNEELKHMGGRMDGVEIKGNVFPIQGNELLSSNNQTQPEVKGAVLRRLGQAHYSPEQIIGHGCLKIN